MNEPLHPRVAAEKRQVIAAEYARNAELFGELTKRCVMFLKANREKFGSDKATQVEWDTTTDGQDMIGLKFKMKGQEREISALKTLIDVANNEARNFY